MELGVLFVMVNDTYCWIIPYSQHCFLWNFVLYSRKAYLVHQYKKMLYLPWSYRITIDGNPISLKRICVLGLSSLKYCLKHRSSRFTTIPKADVYQIISPPPVKPEGTIGLHSVLLSVPPVKPEGTIGLHSVLLSVRPSVCLSVRPSHSFSGLFLAMLSHICMKVGSKLPYEELQIKFDFRHGWPTFSWLIALCSNFVFPDFSWLCFHISEWKLVASFHMKSYRSSSTFVTVDILFHELLLFVQNLFSRLFSTMLSYIWMKVGSKLPYEELQTKFDFRYGWPTFLWVIALCSKFVFRTFLGYAFTYLNESW